MLFHVTRASGSPWRSEEPNAFEAQPCAKARLINTPPEVTCLFDDPKLWVIEIETLDDLLALQQEAGCALILREPNWYGVKGIPSIQIYDSYVE